MGLTNFILTLAGVSAVVLLEVQRQAVRRNVKHIRNWLEEESAAASREAEKVTKEIEEKVSKKNLSGEQNSLLQGWRGLILLFLVDCFKV